MKTMLVPLDGSQLAEQILPFVRLLAPLMHAEVHLLRVVSDTGLEEEENPFFANVAAAYGYGAEHSMKILERNQRAVWERLREEAEGYLTARAEQLRADGLEVRFDAMIGPPAEMILDAANADHISLLAMATHGYGGLRRWALGSVTDRLVHTSPAPMLVVRGREHALADLPPFRRILVPIDGSDLSQKALPMAIDLACLTRADLVLVRAITPMVEAYPGTTLSGHMLSPDGEVLEMLRADAHYQLEQIAARIQAPDVHITLDVLYGYPAEVIVEEAQRHETDLIVMATHGYSGLRRWALGSVADKVLHATATPIVLVRAGMAVEHVQDA